MILEYKIDYRSSSLVYEKIFLNELNKSNLNGNITRDGYILNLFVEANDIDELEVFATSLSNNLPHSIYLYSTQATIIDNMPTSSHNIDTIYKIPSPPCPKCLAKIQESYNIFTQCNVCGYNINGESRSYKDEISKIVKDIKNGKIIELNTFYGKYSIAIPSNIWNDIKFDILAYDLASIEKYAMVEDYELNALASFEKPAIRLKKKIKFTMDYEEIKSELIKFRLADDALLHLLMQELHSVGIDILSITKDKIRSDKEVILVEPNKILEPIEIVASSKNILIIGGARENKISNIKKINPQIDGFNSIKYEYHLSDKYQNIAGLNLSRDYSNIIIDGEKFGLLEYLSFDFSFNSIEDIFNQIELSDEEGKRLISNYKAKFPQFSTKVLEIEFNKSKFSIYQLWGLVAVILDFTDNPFEGAKILENNAMSFLGDRGPRIDYKLQNIDGKVFLNPLMVIRTAISFRLAGVDNLALSYGVIESFLEFITNEVDELKESMGVEAVAIYGSLLSNRRVFQKISDELSINSNIYFNNELAIV
jgi:hypothetical protein